MPYGRRKACGQRASYFTVSQFFETVSPGPAFATFGGLPLTGRLEERQCGVWVVNIETGQTLGFLRFEDLVQEIFDVAVLPGLKFPELAELGSAATDLAYVVPDAAFASAT